MGKGHLEVVKYLVEEAGCDPIALTRDKATMVHRAARRGHLEVVKYLVEEAGVDPHAKTMVRWYHLNICKTVFVVTRKIRPQSI